MDCEGSTMTPHISGDDMKYWAKEIDMEVTESFVFGVPYLFLIMEAEEGSNS